MILILILKESKLIELINKLMLYKMIEMMFGVILIVLYERVRQRNLI